MTPHFLISLLFFTSTLSHFTATSAAGDGSDDTDFIHARCNTTLYPDLCFSSLSRFAAAVQRNPAALARVAIAVALSKAHGVAAFLSYQTAAAVAVAVADDSGTGPALHDCFSNVEDAVDAIRGSLKQMRRLEPDRADSSSLRLGVSNVQTWMSAALTDEETCTDGFEGVAEGTVKTSVCNRVTRVKKFTSNALALVNGFANKL